MEQTLPHGLQKEPVLPRPLFWTASLQNYETNVFKSPVCGTLAWQPRKVIHPFTFTLPPGRSDAMDWLGSRTLIELLG